MRPITMALDGGTGAQVGHTLTRTQEDGVSHRYMRIVLEGDVAELRLYRNTFYAVQDIV
jgi:hypothetical protein